VRMFCVWDMDESSIRIRGDDLLLKPPKIQISIFESIHSLFMVPGNPVCIMCVTLSSATPCKE